MSFNDWQEARFADVAEIIMGQSPKGETCNIEGLGIPLLNGPTEFGEHHPIPAQWTTDSRKVSQPGDILFCVRGSTTGRMNWSDREYALGRGLAALRHKKDLKLNSFIKGLIDVNLNSILTAATGSTFPNVGRELLSNLKINLPPLPVQRSIAAILSSLDDKIENNRKTCEKLEEIAQVIFKQWFVDERHDNWEEVTISKLFEVRDGTHDSPKQTLDGKKLITSKHLISNGIDFNSAYFISDKNFKEINKRSKVDTFDILFSMIGTIGRVYIEQSNDINYAIKNIGLFKTSQNYQYAILTYLWLSGNLGQEYIFKNTRGSTQKYLSLDALRNIKIVNPPEDVLSSFNNVVWPVFKLINKTQKESGVLQQARDILLPKLMSGEIGV